jgi:hypothetical protein
MWFYGGNDGVFRAIKGGQPSAAPPAQPTVEGIEQWAFIPPEFFGKFKRMYNNSPRYFIRARRRRWCPRRRLLRPEHDCMRDEARLLVGRPGRVIHPEGHERGDHRPVSLHLGAPWRALLYALNVTNRDEPHRGLEDRLLPIPTTTRPAGASASWAGPGQRR